MKRSMKDKGQARLWLMTRLQARGPKWTTAQALLQTANDGGTVGVFSEDLQDLVRHGLAECQDTAVCMHQRSFLRVIQRAVCEMCNNTGSVEWHDPNELPDEGWHSEPCPDCTVD